MSIPSSSPARPIFWSNVLLGIAILAMIAWVASLFMTTVPSWHRDVPFLGIVCAAFAGTLRRNARRRQAARQTPQL